MDFFNKKRVAQLEEENLALQSTVQRLQAEIAASKRDDTIPWVLS